jgi:hypothetical protein
MSEMERSDHDVLVCKLCAQTFSSEEMVFTHLLEGHDEDGLASEVERGFLSLPTDG